MAYDAREESRKLIAEGVPEVTFSLTRRRRFLPAAVDVDRDLAATLFMRRGVSGDPWLESWTFERRDGEWQLLGGGAGNGHHEVFDPRPGRADIGALAVRYGMAGSLLNPGRLMPWGARYLRTATLRLASEVHRLEIGERAIDVAPHGLAIVVLGTSRRPPEVQAVSESGTGLGVIDLDGDW